MDLDHLLEQARAMGVCNSINKNLVDLVDEERRSYILSKLGQEEKMDENHTNGFQT